MAQQETLFTDWVASLSAPSPLAGTDKVVVFKSGVPYVTTAQAIQDLAKTGGATGSFTTADVPAKTVTVVAGIITSIV